MAESIGTKYTTQIPSYSENADIQTALKLYHYGQETEPATIESNSVAGHLKYLEDTKVDIIPTVLASGANLNNQTATGYYSATNAVANLGANFPEQVAGILHVINDSSNNFISQTYLALSSNKLYWRNRVSTTWTTWKETSDATHSHAQFATFEPTISLTASKAVVSNTSGKLATSDTTSVQIGYLSNTTSDIQAQINTKAPTASPTFTTSAVLPSNTTIGNVSSTEIGYLDGVTSAIQTQLNNRPRTMNNSTALNNVKIFIQSTTPTGMATGDLWFW